MKTSFFRYQRRYLPQISRFIAASLGVFVLGGLVGGVYTGVFDMRTYAKNPSTTRKTPVVVLQKEYDAWQSVVAKKPEYIDGYIMVSYYAKMLGKKEEARSYLHQALVIDPNSHIVRDFLQDL